MKITNVEVKKIKSQDERIKGLANVVIDESFVIHDIRIIKGNNDLFLAMPSRKTATGDYRDIAHPINQKIRKMFEEAIFKELNKENKSDE